MHGIQRYHYERLRGYLCKLRLDSEMFDLPCEHLNTIVGQEKHLKQTYDNYQESLRQIADIIKQYEREYKNVQQLMNNHRQLRKQLQKKILLKEI